MTPRMDDRTYLACLTPAGAGAIASLAVRGPQAWTIVRDLFQPSHRPLPPDPEPGRFWLGRLGEDARGGADDVVLAVKRATPTPWLEVHCHGGPEVIRLLEEVFVARGVLGCSWQELERRPPARRRSSWTSITARSTGPLRPSGPPFGSTTPPR